MDENSNSQSSSESVEVHAAIDQGGSPMMNGTMDGDHYSDEENGRPYIEIVEQPQQRGFRFRYECEGPSHGGLQGNQSEKFKKTVPTIRIKNYSGHAKVVVSLVTCESVPKPHAHRLVGKHCHDGLCTVEVKPGTTQVSFSNLCVQHVTRKKASEVLEQRILTSYQLQKQVQTGKFNMTFQPSEEEIKQAKSQAQAQSKNMALNVVRLCYQVFLLDEAGNQTGMLNSVISDPIYDSKAPGANALKICRMDKYSGCCIGNEEVFLLCEKVQREDIMVKFVEQDVQGNVLWEAQGHFGPFDVHRQFAIVFKTPEYRDTNIEHPVNVLVMLVRKSDNESSDPKSFTYYPKSIDKEEIDRKRRKVIPGANYDQSRGGFRDMDPSNRFGGHGKGNSGGNSENGLQNGSSIPNFDNLRKDPFGRSAEQVQRYILKAQRQNLPAKVPPSTPPMDPTLVNFLTNPNQCTYETISRQEQQQLLQNVNSPPYMDTSPTASKFPISNGPMCMTTQYDNSTVIGSPHSGNGSSMIGSPHNGNGSSMIGSPHSVNGSVHMSAMSPNSVNPLSPQAGLNSPQSMQESNMGLSSSQMHNYIQGLVNIKVEDVPVGGEQMSSAQMNQPIMAGSLNQISQPTPDTGVEIDYLENNFNYLQQLDYGRFQQQSSVHEIRNALHAYDDFHTTCSYQARGASNEPINLQEFGFGLDFVDAVRPKPVTGYDEPDCTLVQQPKALDLSTYSKIESKGKNTLPVDSFQTKLGKDDVKYVETENVLVKDDKTVMTDNVEVREATNFAVQTLHTADIAVQTDMDQTTHQSLMRTADALQYYAASGDIRSLLMVQRYLMLVQDQDGDLPLHTSLINQKFEVFQNLLDVMRMLPDSYSRINAYNFHHQTPLHLAVITNHPAAVDLLIRAGGDTTLVDRNGYTPAHLAVFYKHTQCLKNLLKYVRPNTDLKKPFPELNVRCYSGFTPAHLAAQMENLEAMKLLVYGKADVNLQDGKSGQTTLHHAVECDDLSLSAYLILQAGSGVNIKRFDGNTALHIACGRGNVGMVALLMAGGADPNIENDDVEDSEDGSDAGEENNNLKDKVVVETTNAAVDAVKEEGKELVEQESADEAETVKEAEDPDAEDKEVKQPVKKGLLPADFADGNEKILRVLNGEPYKSLRDYSDDEDNTSGTDLNSEQKIDRLTSINYSKIESGIGSLSLTSSGSDLETLDIQTRLSLSKLLDPSQTGCDWSALAEKLGLKRYMDGQLGEQSPTGLLLTCLENNGGTVSMLCNALADIKREDAVGLLQNQSTKGSPSSDKLANRDPKLANKDPWLDSGMELERPIAGTEN